MTEFGYYNFTTASPIPVAASFFPVAAGIFAVFMAGILSRAPDPQLDVQFSRDRHHYQRYDAEQVGVNQR